MSFLGRLRPGRVEVPAAVRDRLPDSGERVLAAAAAEHGGWLLGTRDHLHLVLDEETHTLPWERVQRADWDKETSTLRVEQVEAYGHPVTSFSFVVTEPGDLLTMLRERVTASVVLQRRVELGRKRGFSVIGRRPPRGTGEITWAYEFDGGVDPDDPEVMAAAEAALREARESLGL